MTAHSRSPFLTRFLSDFTLGFSDGLTVPFALTAGLSSLGRTDTVIYAGLAELCAGSISMGIGGYLAARDELPSVDSESEKNEGDEDEEKEGMLRGGSGKESLDERSQEGQEGVIQGYLEPLGLPDIMVVDIMANLKSRPEGLSRLIERVSFQASQRQHEISDSRDSLPIWPVASGLSISLGYIVGGIIPLLPYFFAATVGIGLRWSIGSCLLALMVFGTGKGWLLRGGRTPLLSCLWEGAQMLILGSLAAAAAVLCVTIVGASSGEPLAV